VALGPPGSGKSTLARLLSERAHVPWISTGDLLRREIARGTPLGSAAEPWVSAGLLVPDELVAQLVHERLEALAPGEGYVLDGYPRSRAQADELWRWAQARGLEPSAVLELDVPDPVLFERVRERAGREQRSDDDPATFAERMDVYRDETVPVIDFFRDRGVLRPIDGRGSIEDVLARAELALGPGERTGTGS